MEGKPKILQGECLLLVYGCCQEICVVNSPVFVKIDGFKYVLQVLSFDVWIYEGLLYIIQI